MPFRDTTYKQKIDWQNAGIKENNCSIVLFHENARSISLAGKLEVEPREFKK